jgi:hypothetical protein
MRPILRYSTFNEAYKAYRTVMLEKNLRPYSFSGFCGMLYNWAIGPLRYDRYACPLCYAMYASRKSIQEIEQDPHKIQQNNIWSIYTDHVDGLRKGDRSYVVVIMDYSRVHELGAVKQDEGEEATKLSILHFTVITAGNEERAYDCFATGKQGPIFVKDSMAHFMPRLKELAQNAAKIYFWSDGGLKTYGTVRNMFQLAKDVEKSIVHHFFPPYHGHSRCDAHFGRGKRELRNRFPNGGLANIFQVMDTFNGIPGAYTELLSKIRPKEEGTYSKWPSGKGIRSCDAVKYEHGQISVISLKTTTPSSWKQVEFQSGIFRAPLVIRFKLLRTLPSLRPSLIRCSIANPFRAGSMSS